MIDVCIKNCKLSPKSENICINIDYGKIKSISKIPKKAEKTINAENKLVLPGLIDAHVHFRDPGLTQKETFKTGSQSAANGGFTTIIDMPNTLPKTNTYSNFKEKLKIASNKSIVDYGLHAGTENIKEIPKIDTLNPISYKIFMDLNTDNELDEIFKTISQKTDKPITLHPENKVIVEKETQNQKNQNKTDAISYADARPPQAEIESTKQAISLSQKYDTQIHLCHISTPKTLKLVEETKNSKITCEITPHHLLLTTDAFKKYGTYAKTNPPLRHPNENLNLSYLNKIDTIGTDHAPHTLEEKQKDVWNASPGIPNLETCLPLLLNEVNKGTISFDIIKEKLCTNPAKIFDLNQKGEIAPEKDADLVLIDLNKEIVVDTGNFYTKGKYTPFEGMTLKGAPILTMLRGNIIMEDNIVYENKGKLVL
jgi:dihydroorotase